MIKNNLDILQNTPNDLTTLDADTQTKIVNTAAASKADNTLRAYRSDLKQVCKYLADIGHADMVKQNNGAWQLARPMSAQLVAAYLIKRSEHGTALTTLQRHVASISKYHQVLANTNTAIVNPCHTQLVRDVVAGLRKQNDRQAKRAKPITPGQVAAIVESLDLKTLRGVRDRAVILLGWCGAMRRSEIANLTWAQLKFVAEGLQITVMQGKTDTTGQGQAIGLPYQNNAELCPVAAMVAWAHACNQTKQTNTKVFVQISQHGQNTQQPLSGQAIGNIVSACASRVGLHGYTGHSLRSGLATAAILAGTPEYQVMNTTRHKSQAVFRNYVRHAELFSKAASRGLLS